MVEKSKFLSFIFISSLVLFTASCSNTYYGIQLDRSFEGESQTGQAGKNSPNMFQNSQVDESIESKFGFVRVALTNTPIDEGKVTAVNVCIERVDLVFADEQTKGTIHVSKTINLLELRDGVTTSLGIGEFPVGTIQQVHLILRPDDGSVVIDGVEQPLTIPSGEQSCLNLAYPGGFEIREDITTTFVLDLDAERSLHFAPGQGWKLTPVVQLVEAPIVIAVTEPSLGAFVQPTMTVRGTVESKEPLASLTVNGIPASVVGMDWSAEIALPEGSELVTVNAVDIEGHSAVVNTEVFVDGMPPNINLSSPASKSMVTKRASIPLLIILDDSTSGVNIDATEVYVDNIQLGINDFQVFDWTIATELKFDEGAHEIRVVAYDLADNYSTAENHFTVVQVNQDKLEPTLDLLFWPFQANSIAQAITNGDSNMIVEAIRPVSSLIRGDVILVNTFVKFKEAGVVSRDWLISRGAQSVICGRLPNICMAELPLYVIPELSREPILTRIEALPAEIPALSNAVPLVGADVFHNRVLPIRGAGQIIAIHETRGGLIGGGPDVFHPAFINADGKSKIRSILYCYNDEQPDPGCPNPNLHCAPRDPFGNVLEGYENVIEIDRSYINRMLSYGSEEAARAAGLTLPSQCVNSHGTSAAGIAAGNGINSSGYLEGVAPDAELIVAVGPNPLFSLEYFFGPARYPGPDPFERPALSANQPIVALTETQSLTGGGHAGVSTDEQYVDALVFGGPNRIFIRPAGNCGDCEGCIGYHRTYNLITADNNICENDPGCYGVEVGFWVATSLGARIYFNPELPLSVEVEDGWGNTVLLDPDAEEIRDGSTFPYFFNIHLVAETTKFDPAIHPKESYVHVKVGGTHGTLVWIRLRAVLSEQQAADESLGVIDIYTPKSAEFYGPGSNVEGAMDYLATARSAIAVGNFDALNGNLADTSGRGPSRDPAYTGVKPEIVAPGNGIYAPALGGGVTEFGGTSASSPMVAGAVALLFEKHGYLTVEEVESLLMRGAVIDDFVTASGPVPNGDWGYGKLHIDPLLPKVDPEVACPIPDADFAPRVSANGDILFFLTTRSSLRNPYGNLRLAALNMTSGTDMVLIPPFDSLPYIDQVIENDFDVSDSGKKILFTSNRDGENFELFTVEYDPASNTFKNISQITNTSNFNHFLPRYSSRFWVTARKDPSGVNSVFSKDISAGEEPGASYGEAILDLPFPGQLRDLDVETGVLADGGVAAIVRYSPPTGTAYDRVVMWDMVMGRPTEVGFSRSQKSGIHLVNRGVVYNDFIVYGSGCEYSVTSPIVPSGQECDVYGIWIGEISTNPFRVENWMFVPPTSGLLPSDLAVFDPSLSPLVSSANLTSGGSYIHISSVEPRLSNEPRPLSNRTWAVLNEISSDLVEWDHFRQLGTDDISECMDGSRRAAIRKSWLYYSRPTDEVLGKQIVPQRIFRWTSGNPEQVTQ